MKILTAAQVKLCDKHTITNDNISSLDLMERASETFCKWFTLEFSKEENPVVSIICGKGNNGGDGLATARILKKLGYETEVFILDVFPTSSDDFSANLNRLKQDNAVKVTHIAKAEDLPIFDETEILIDAILGSGLTRNLDGELERIVNFVNECNNIIVSMDIPSGMFADDQSFGTCIQADYTFTFEGPKFSFLLPDNFVCVGEFVYDSIGLDKKFINSLPSHNYYVTEETAKRIYKIRPKFAHKGLFGHALLVMGSHGKMGAAILATRACLRSGAGLVTVHVPGCGYDVMQMSIPEAMVTLDEDQYIFTRVYELQKYNTVAVGCGLSTKNKTRNALCYILKNMENPAVLDADALNILAQSPDWMEFIPKNSILTPHPKEFERMFGRTENGYDRYELLRAKAIELGVYIILKGANSCIATPNGDCYFNSTGNPGMGTAGSGDVLTGIISGLLAQEYTPLEASILGVYLHGLAGDIAAEELSQEALMAGDLIENLGKAFMKLLPSDKKIHRHVGTVKIS
jgi:ADP-dependent NAD(P)H-hydrate dehydratase / NAD(P)H-hydrate epimerase